MIANVDEIVSVFLIIFLQTVFQLVYSSMTVESIYLFIHLCIFLMGVSFDTCLRSPYIDMSKLFQRINLVCYMAKILRGLKCILNRRFKICWSANALTLHFSYIRNVKLFSFCFTIYLITF